MEQDNDQLQAMMEDFALQQQLIELQQENQNLRQRVETHQPMELLQQNQQVVMNMLQTIQHLQQQLSAQTRNQIERLPDFKMPSVKPPTFKGDTKSQPPHEAQYVIQDYLRQAKNAAETNDLRGDGEAPRFRNHKTWVTWLKSGLQGEALRLWDELPDAEKNDMTWIRYQQWIHDTFSSPLTLEGAWSSLISLRQSGSCVDYNKKFNVLRHAIEAEGINLPEKILCIEYRRGLKDSLAKEPAIMEYDQITALQTHAERLDKMQHDRAKMTNNLNNAKGKNDTGKNQSFRNSAAQDQWRSAPSKDILRSSPEKKRSNTGRTAGVPFVDQRITTTTTATLPTRKERPKSTSLKPLPAPTMTPAQAREETSKSLTGTRALPSGPSGIERATLDSKSEAASSVSDPRAATTIKTKPPGFAQEPSTLFNTI
ncbi:hypothetical protein HDU67_007098, partial [Dinochytrium kinnereticum]